MHKYYLTYQFAVGFERACGTVELPEAEGNELRRCAKNMICHLSRSLYLRQSADKCKHLFVSLTYLRDCWDLLKKAQADVREIQGPFTVLEGRLEQLCLDASIAEQGQLRMLG